MIFNIKNSKGLTLLELIISMALAMIVLTGVSYQLIFMIKEDARTTKMQELEQLRDIIRTNYNCENTIANPSSAPLKDGNTTCYATTNEDIAILCNNTATMETKDIEKKYNNNNNKKLAIVLYDKDNNPIFSSWTHGSTINYGNYVVRAVCCDTEDNESPDPFIKVEVRLKSLSETGPWQDIFEIVPLIQCFD